MKKPILLAALLLIATNSFCQWTPGYFNDEFGDKSNDKYLEFTSKDGSFSKEGMTVVNKSTLVVYTKIYRNQDIDTNPYNLCFELFENGGSKAINSTNVFESKVIFNVKLNDGQILTYPVYATEGDLRTQILVDEDKLIESIQKDIKPIRCILKIDSRHTIARYSFSIDPSGLSDALSKHLALEPKPTTAKRTSTIDAPVIIDNLVEDMDMDVKELDSNIVVIEDKPVYGVEQMPQFPGGEEELLKFIRDNLRYPPVAAKVGIEGRVTIRFVVNRNGDITDVTVIRGLDPSCDKEAVRVIKMMPKWIPGRQNGRNVPVYYMLPVVYKMNK